MTAITLEQVHTTKVGDLAALPIAELSRLIDESLAQKALYERITEWLRSATAIKYNTQLAEGRADKATGTIHIHDDGYIVTEEVPKKVKWDQAALEAIALQLANEGKDPKDYIDASFRVLENTYKSLPVHERARFDDARTLIPQKPRLTIKRES